MFYFLFEQRKFLKTVEIFMEKKKKCGNVEKLRISCDLNKKIKSQRNKKRKKKTRYTLRWRIYIAEYLSKDANVCLFVRGSDKHRKNNDEYKYKKEKKN